MSEKNDNLSKVCARHGCRRRAKSKFCSDTCRVAHHNAKRAPAVKVRIMCLGCKSVFHGRPDQKTCSATCRSRVFRARKQHQAEADSAPMSWSQTTPFSPAELKKRMQAQPLEPGVEYSWLPVAPKKVRVRRNPEPTNQMRFDFFEGPPPAEAEESSHPE